MTIKQGLIPLFLSIFLLLEVPLYAQENITFAWEYDAVEAVHVTEWKLYQSNTTGGPYSLVPVSIMKIADQSAYQEVIPSTSLLKGQVFFVLTAYGDDTYPIAERESGYSNEVNHTFSLSQPYNLILTITPE